MSRSSNKDTLRLLYTFGISGRFPFTKILQKFRLGCKWNMLFLVRSTEKFPERMELVKKKSRFPVGNFSDGTACSIYEFHKV